ncbi:MAG TPA: hypothetical protein DDW23_05625 [Planctomycetes bacterium]|nr:hypothetical protein [Planctomycetota bacterium]
MKPTLRVLAALLTVAAIATSTGFPGGGGNRFIDKYLGDAVRLKAEGNVAAACVAVDKALERDDRHYQALDLRAELALMAGDRDMAAYCWHQWLEVASTARAAKDRDAAPSRKEEKRIEEALIAVDYSAETFTSLVENYIDGLRGIEKEHSRRKRFHAALGLLEEILHVNPYDIGAHNRIKSIRREGGKDLATEDIYAGTDPTFGADPEWIAEEDLKHSTWETAWRKDGENYSYRTDAGFLILQTASIAMEQMNKAYRKFFRYKEDGDPTPRVTVHVFKSRDEYLELGIGPPVEWSGGHYTGSHVETYVGGVSGEETVRQMYGTLFHEAAHQFVGLTGRGGVPGWLNEAYASFFEGCTILSNGQVRWNEVATHRLFPVASRMENGWMTDHADGVRDETGEWATPERAPTFRILVENQYQWGPPWYAPTWAVVYFLYNYRDPESGQPVYRDTLHEYYLSGAGHLGKDRRVPHFEDIVLQAKLSPVASIDELDAIWRAWILDLRDVQLGKKAAGKSNFDLGKQALEQGELGLAEEFFDEAFLHSPEDPEILWKLAGVLEAQKEKDRALALFTSFAREMELRGTTDDPRYPEAREKIRKLDPLFRRHEKLKEEVQERGLELAQEYRSRGMPRMAMEIARRMSANFSMPAALDFYSKVARESGLSLARWRVAYNEFDLEGWSGGEGSFEPYGRQIQSAVREDPSLGEGVFLTNELACDVLFDADFSIEAEIQFGSEATLGGICFGRKDAENTHAAVIHPGQKSSPTKGFLDVSTKHGSEWTYHDHTQVNLKTPWNLLRVDVVGDTVDIHFNGHYLLSRKMPSRDSLQGAFGLIGGVGKVQYQNIRILARDPHDPAARIEREIAMEQRAENPELRAPGVFSGQVPPPLQVSDWIQGEPLTLEELRGRPAVLVFWTPQQDQFIPVAAYYSHLQNQYSALGVRWVAVVDNSNTAASTLSWLSGHPLEGVNVALDDSMQTFEAYNVKDGGWGMPRIILLDVDGKVAWEGSPGLKAGVGWMPGDPETYFDGPIKSLVENRKLAELVDLKSSIAKVEDFLQSGNTKTALEILIPLVALDADFDPEVRKGKTLLAALESQAQQSLIGSRAAKESRYLAKASSLLLYLETKFPGTAAANSVPQERKILEGDPAWRDTVRAWRTLAKAVREAERGRDASFILPHLEKAQTQSSNPGIKDAIESMRNALFGPQGPDGLIEHWHTLPGKGL